MGRFSKIGKEKNVFLQQIICNLHLCESLYCIHTNLFLQSQCTMYLRWVLYHLRVSYLITVTLQMVYCHYLFKDSVAKNWKFNFLGATPNQHWIAYTRVYEHVKESVVTYWYRSLNPEYNLKRSPWSETDLLWRSYQAICLSR